MAALLLPLASCDDEPEVGSTLYPESPENYDAKLYINETALPGNQTSLEVVQTPVSLIIPDNEISFYVRLTKPVTTDVTVNVTENPELAEAYLSDAEALPEGSLQLANTSVTIKAGSTVSEQPTESDGKRSCEKYRFYRRGCHIARKQLGRYCHRCKQQHLLCGYQQKSHQL